MAGNMVEVLQSADIFWGLEQEDIELFAEILPRQRVGRGEPLFTQGEHGDSLHIIVEGRLQVHVTDHEGRVVTLYLLEAGDCVGGLACIEPGPRSVTAVALQPTRTLVIDVASLHLIQEESTLFWTAILGGIMRHAAKRLRSTNLRAEELLNRIGRGYSVPMPASPVVRPEPERSSSASRAFRGPVDWPTIPIPEGLEPDDLPKLAAVGMVRVWEPGSTLCHEGRPGASCFFVLQGSVEVMKASMRGARVLARLGAGELVGQVCLVDNLPRSASLRAAEDLVVLEIHRSDFDRLVSLGKPLALSFQRLIALCCARQLYLANTRLVEVVWRS